MSSWKTIIQWDLIEELVKEALGIKDSKLDEESKEQIKEHALKIFEERHFNEDIYEMEISDIENELVGIFLDMFSGGTKPTQNQKRIFIELNRPPISDPELNYISKMFEQIPSLKHLFKKNKGKNIDEDDEDPQPSSMYI